MKAKKDIVIYKMNGQVKEGFELPNVDVEDINTLYNILKPYGVKIGLKREEK